MYDHDTGQLHAKPLQELSGLCPQQHKPVPSQTFDQYRVISQAIQDHSSVFFAALTLALGLAAFLGAGAALAV